MADNTRAERMKEPPSVAERVEAFGRARRHSRRVRVLRWLVPALALSVAGSFVAYSFASRQLGPAMEATEKTVADGKVVMANPKLEGFAKDGRPYVMTASKAVQELARQQVISLEGISARMPVEAGNWAEVKGASGIYDRAANTFQFTSPVSLKTTDGLETQFASAFLDLANSALRTDAPVDITRQASTVLADSMSMVENGKKLVFEKNVRMTLNPTSLPGQANGGNSASQ